jgi:catechol-2,3-dioxygenase
MIKARRIGHAVFETSDLDRLSEHYTDVIGLTVAAREKDKVFLASKLGHLAVELRRGSNAGCRKLSFEVTAGTNLADVESDLKKHGVASARSNDTAPGIANVLTFEDPKGTQVELFTAWNALAVDEALKGAAVQKLGHVAYFTTDLQKTMEFYATVLGFKVSDWIGDFFVFMRCNPDHHTVNFMKGEENRLHHIAFQLDDWGQMKTACDVLGRNGVDLAWGPVRHGPGHNIAVYHRNPDDQIIELFCDLDTIVDEELGYFEPRPWHRDNPQRPKVWEPGPTSNIWGPPPSEAFRRK